MAWVRFPDGTRRKVERVDKADAQRDLDELLALRAQSLDPGPRRQKKATFAEVIDAWMEAGCPTVSPSRRTRHVRVKSPNTIANAGQLLRTSVLPVIGKQWVERTGRDRLEELFKSMAAKGYATSTIDRTWGYLNQACEYGVRKRLIKTNPAADVMLPAVRPPKKRKSFTIDEAQRLLTDGIPSDPRPAMWLTGLMCGLRPGELAGLRWPYVDLDSDEPSIDVFERAVEVDDKYVGQGSTKTARGERRLGLHPLLVAALQRHRDEAKMLGTYDAEGFVFCTRTGSPMTMSNMRRAFRTMCAKAGLGDDWTTYELRHSFVSLVADQLDSLMKVADLAGHVDTRTTENYRHTVRPTLPHAVEAWDRLLASADAGGVQGEVEDRDDASGPGPERTNDHSPEPPGPVASSS
jgi:integrase